MTVSIRSATYRPLRSGSKIINAAVGRPGTLGCIGIDDEGPWIVSSYHVIGRVRDVTAGPSDGESIWQSTTDRGGSPIALSRLSKMDRQLDIAAALILPDVGISADILEMHQLRGVTEPAFGMRVIKSGAGTGVTEGVITDTTSELVTIESPQHMPEGYVLSDLGDSGAVWVDALTGQAVALHFAGRDGNTAYARPLSLVLNSLGLRLHV